MKLHNLPAAATLLALCLLAPTYAEAGVIYGSLDFNPGPFAFNADVFATTTFEQAGDFVLNEGANVITDIHWWGAYGGGDALADDDFYIRIFADDGTGFPQDAPSILDLHLSGVDRVDTGVSSGDVPLFAYSTDIAPLSLVAGTTYYLSIWNHTPNDSDNWFWLGGTDDRDRHWSRDSNAPEDWEQAQYGLLFALTDDQAVVPEPSGLVLLGLGLTALGLRRRGSKRRE